MESIYRVRVKNGEYEIEVESTDKQFVEAKLKAYATVEAAYSPPTANVRSTNSQVLSTSLAKLIKDHKISSQNMKFLAGAVYLSLRGKSNLKPSDITAALRDAGQPRLSNPSENLAQNIQRGFLERISKTEFMVTVHGKEQLGFE